MSAHKSHFDIIIIGAGIQGLAAAHTFLTLDPTLTLLILDDKSSVGGTWAKEQIYANLRACNLQGFFEFTDCPLLSAGLGVTPRGILTGKVISAYLQQFAEKFGLLAHTRLETRVVSATSNETDEVRAWSLELEGAEGKEVAGPRTVTCAKLLVCTGQTSQAKMPAHKGAETFGRPIIHSKDLAKEGERLRTDPSVEHVTIIGAVKSGHDAVYNYATAGKKVTWLVRNNPGSRKAWLSKPFPAVGPMHPWLEGLLMTRPLSWMGAAPWSTGDGFGGARAFLHNTAIGRFIVRSYFGQVSGDTVKNGGLLTLEKSDALTPEATLQWYGGQAAILNYEKDIYQVIKDTGVDIIRESIDHLDPGTVVLADGHRIKTDAIINATGYHFGPSFPVLPATEQTAWGVPVHPNQDTIFKTFEEKADKELLERFPELENSPAGKVTVKYPGLTPWRLWRFIAPPSQVASGSRNLVFLTNAETYQNVLKAELTSLWAYAYLHNNLAVDVRSEKEIQYEATLWSRFGWWHKPLGKQGMSGDMFHEGMAYYDRLLLDLGLNTWRKGWGLLGEIFGGHYEVRDYAGIKEEWLAKKGSKRS